MEAIEVITRKVGACERNLKFKKVVLGFEDRNRLESDIIPELYCFRNRFFISNNSYFVMTGRFISNPEYKTETNHKLIDTRRLVDTDMSRMYMYNNELRKRFMNDIKALIKKAKLKITKAL